VSTGGGDTDPGSPAPTDSISGTVRFKGLPLQGATVAAFLTNTTSTYGVTTTDVKGDYSFSGVKTSGQAPLFRGFMASQYYWTSSTDAADPDQAWTVFSCDFGVYNTPKPRYGTRLRLARRR
jgi:hypothetical protein